ncbi:MAG: hypothetical protein ACI9TK_000621 [Flavobacteriaceae bacterium]|jgi:hypothetical protein|tara:strand:- start:7909 stop:8724 length:816 start_codon:yes stop_codon:yes gene_type:complete
MIISFKAFRSRCLSIVLLFLYPLVAFPSAWDEVEIWGATGHRVIGEVATQHISKRTAKALNELLDGESLAYVSNYGDDIKSDNTYDKYYAWHYVNLNLDESYAESVKNPKGDIVIAIQDCIEVLKSTTESKENKQFFLKLLIHFIGDLHQPMHLGQLEDKGGNDINVKWFGKNSNLHRVWDSGIVDSHGMSYSEIAINLPLLRADRIKSIQNISLNDWLSEIHNLTNRIYNTIPEKTNLGYEYRYEYIDIVRIQLLKGGIHLAGVLNKIFE